MLRASSSSAMSSRLLEGVTEAMQEKVEGGAEFDTLTDGGSAEVPPDDGSTAATKGYWEDIQNKLRDQGFTNGEIVGIIIGSIIGFLVVLCIIFIFLGAIQYYNRQKALEAKMAADGVNGVGQIFGDDPATSAVPSTSRNGSEKDK